MPCCVNSRLAAERIRSRGSERTVIGSILATIDRSVYKACILLRMPYAEPADPPPTDTRSLVRDRLSKVLEDCRPATITALVDAARIRPFRAGELIYRQGEVVPLTLVLAGYGISRRTTADGQQLLSGVVPSGVPFGYSGIAAAISTVEIVALSNGLVANWRGSEMRELVKSDVALGLVAIDALAGSLHA